MIEKIQDRLTCSPIHPLHPNVREMPKRPKPTKNVLEPRPPVDNISAAADVEAGKPNLQRFERGEECDLATDAGADDLAEALGDLETQVVDADVEAEMTDAGADVKGNVEGVAAGGDDDPSALGASALDVGVAHDQTFAVVDRRDLFPDLTVDLEDGGRNWGAGRVGDEVSVDSVSDLAR